MKGDLVFEKLGEVDPSLLAGALPGAVPTMRTDTLHAPPRKRPSTGWRIALVIAASLAMTVVLLAVGGASLFAGVTWPWESGSEETTPEDHDGKELTYQGTVSIDGFGALTGSDELEVMGNELKARFTAATPMEDVCLCWRDLPIQIGDTTLTYNRDHGCFRDGDTGQIYQLWEQDKEYINNLLTDLESRSNILSFVYEYDTLRRGDDFVFSVGWREGYGSVFKIEKVYLRYEGEDTEYVTPGFFTVGDQEDTYRIHIMDDAPYGKYTLVAHVYSPYTGRNIEMDIPSKTGAIEIVPNETEPAYTFTRSITHEIYNRGETIFVDVVMVNNGDPILRWTKNLTILPEVSLRKVSDGKSYPMNCEQEIDWSGHVARLDSGEASEGRFSMEIPSSMPIGVYDLVLSFEGHEQVYPNVIAIVDPNANHGFAVDYSFTPKDGEGEEPFHTVTNNGTGFFSLRITHAGDTLYRYGYDDCLRPDSVKLYRQEEGSEGENAPFFYATHTEKTKTLWAWENGMTKTFLYEWDWETAPIEPGAYTLQVVYRDQDGNILLDLILEDALTVVTP